MFVTNNKTHLSTVKSNIYLQDLLKKDIRNLTHPWGIHPVTYLEEVRHQSRINKFLTLQESFNTMSKSSLNTEQQQQKNIYEITNTLENLKTMHAKLLTLDEYDIENATRFGREIMLIITELLLHVVNQIGQTNVQTPTLESIIAYIRCLIHMKSAHMRQTIPGPLLIAWYDISQLMSLMQNEPELRITNKKTRQLIDIANDTAAWAYKHLSTERLNNDPIIFIDRSSTSCTYE